MLQSCFVDQNTRTEPRLGPGRTGPDRTGNLPIKALTFLYYPPWKSGSFTFISLQHVFVRLGELLLLRVVGGQQTRYEPGHGASASRLVKSRGLGLQTTAVTRSGPQLRLPALPPPLPKRH